MKRKVLQFMKRMKKVIRNCFCKKILDIANIQPIELTEKKCLFNKILSLVCEIKKDH